MLKHFIYLSSSKSTTSSLCSLYYRYSSKLSSFFCILSFLVRATSIDQTFYSTTHYLAVVWLDSRHNLNTISIFSQSLQWLSSTSIKNFTLEWVLIQIQLTTKWLVNDLKLERQMILSSEWKSYWASIINNWKKWSWSSKFRSININETSHMK